MDDTKNVSIFDPNDPVYNDICHPFTNDKSDLPLKDRRDALYQNVSLCETGCQMEGIDFKMKTVECPVISRLPYQQRQLITLNRISFLI